MKYSTVSCPQLQWAGFPPVLGPITASSVKPWMTLVVCLEGDVVGRICVSPVGLNVCQLKKHRMTLPGPTDNGHSPLAQMTEVMTQVAKGGNGGAQTQTLGFLTRGPASLTEKIGPAPRVINCGQGAPNPGQGPWVTLVCQLDFPLLHPKKGKEDVEIVRPAIAFELLFIHTQATLRSHSGPVGRRALSSAVFAGKPCRD